MKYQVAKMSIAQTAKVAAILYAVMGLVHFVIGVFIILFGKGPAIGVGILFIIMPVLAAIFGFIGRGISFKLLPYYAILFFVIHLSMVLMILKKDHTKTQ